MKKSIYIFVVGLLAAIGLSTTSCEDMFTPDNGMVTTDLAPKDTLYQMMGIFKRMQKLATRTILLGEVRADLVDINEKTPLSIQELSKNSVSLDNEYNNPRDYYDVINNCNTYLKYVDSLLMTHGEGYYEKEIMAVKTCRAWTYLELAKIYGEIPFYTDPITSSAEADNIIKSTENRKSMEEICDFFIKDLDSYQYMDKNDALCPRYKVEGVSYQPIPARVMLAELYLWRGSVTQSKDDFINAVRLYHDFLTFTNEEHATTASYTSEWTDLNNQSWSSSYISNFIEPDNRDIVSVIPLDTIEFYGTCSDLRAIFCSSYKNDYYALVNPSEYIKEVSQDQKYCQCISVKNSSKPSVSYKSDDVAQYTSPLEKGDLRLASVYYLTNLNDRYHNYNSVLQNIYKYSQGEGISTDKRLSFIPLFRYNILYLHMAEALNRAGFPETAFAVLKYGLSEEIMSDRSIISEYEYERLKEIKTRGYSIGTTNSFVEWPKEYFQPMKYGSAATNLVSTTIQIGIHSIGSGDASYNEYYTLPVTDEVWADYNVKHDEYITYNAEFESWKIKNRLTIFSSHEDSVNYEIKEAEYLSNLSDLVAEVSDEYDKAYLEQRTYYPDFVAQKILEEEALEGMFEGHRFYDLMRYALYTGNPDFIAEQVAKRKGKESTNPSANNLKSGNWYIPLRKK